MSPGLVGVRERSRRSTGPCVSSLTSSTYAHSVVGQGCTKQGQSRLLSCSNLTCVSSSCYTTSWAHMHNNAVPLMQKRDRKAKSGVCSASRVACTFLALRKHVVCMVCINIHLQLANYVSGYQTTKVQVHVSHRPSSVSPTQADHPTTDSGALDSSRLCSLCSACLNSQCTKPEFTLCMQQDWLSAQSLITGACTCAFKPGCDESQLVPHPRL